MQYKVKINIFGTFSIAINAAPLNKKELPSYYSITLSVLSGRGNGVSFNSFIHSFTWSQQTLGCSFFCLITNQPWLKSLQ